MLHREHHGGLGVFVPLCHTKAAIPQTRTMVDLLVECIFENGITALGQYGQL